MSNPLENKSLMIKSSEEFRVTGWEIQPYKAKEMVVDYGSPALHMELARILKSMISQSLSKSKLKPPLQKIENSYENAMVGGVAKTNPDTGVPKRGRPPTSTLVRELAVSFQPPKNCIANKIDIDKVALNYRNYFVPHGEGKITSSSPQFSFKERLEGWTIECRQRQTNIFDLFYRHTKARRTFRSIVEVVKFMLYETYPNSSRKENKEIVEDNNQDKHMMIADASAIFIRETKPISDEDKGKQKEIMFKMAEKKFLEESYRNIMSFVPEDPNYKKGRKWEFQSQEVSSHESEYHHLRGLGNETVEDMLETMDYGLRYMSTENKKRVIMNMKENQGNFSVKKPRMEEGSDTQSAQLLLTNTAEKETKQEVHGSLENVQDDELDDEGAAEVLLNLKNAKIYHKKETSRFSSKLKATSKGFWAEKEAMFEANSDENDRKQHTPVSIRIHELAKFLLKIEEQNKHRHANGTLKFY